MYTVLLQRDSRNEVCLQRINADLRQEFDYEREMCIRDSGQPAGHKGRQMTQVCKGEGLGVRGIGDVYKRQPSRKTSRRSSRTQSCRWWMRSSKRMPSTAQR